MNEDTLESLLTYLPTTQSTHEGSEVFNGYTIYMNPTREHTLDGKRKGAATGRRKISYACIIARTNSKIEAHLMTA